MGEYVKKNKFMRQEIPYLHLVRVVACVMVVCLHTLPTSDFAVEGWDGHFKALTIWLTRPCVPLFLMITGILLLPYRGENLMAFYKKRLLRIIFPLLFWGIVYSVLPYLLGMETMEDVEQNILFLPFTYPTAIGGILWYLYILIGIYLVIPFLNPAIFDNKRFMLVYIAIWFLGSFVVILKSHFSLVLGMTPFCDFDLLLYFSGYLGFLFLGKYLHTCSILIGKSKNSIQAKMLAVYFILTCSAILLQKILSSNLVAFLSFTSIIMSACMFLFLKNCSLRERGGLYTLLKRISPLAFGIYLSHMVIFRVLSIHLYFVSTSFMMQILVMLVTFMGTWGLNILVSKLPFSKYIIGT